jgi:hypothetical protein
MPKGKESEVYTRYPYSSVFIYNSVTAIHFTLGGLGIFVGYNFSWPALIGGTVYLALAFFEMYILMPLTVCPNCVYYKIEGSLCVSGMSVVSRKIAGEGDASRFAERAQGLLCHNNWYMASLFVPLIALLPALFINFSPLLLIIFLTVLGLLLFRFFVIFKRIACIHCRAKRMCPNAQSMGIE